MKLHPTLQGLAPAFDVSSVLQLLEAQRATGRFRLGSAWLWLRDGLVVCADAEPVDTVARLIGASGSFSFTPSTWVCGALSLRVTGLLLEAARIVDEAAQGSKA